MKTIPMNTARAGTWRASAIGTSIPKQSTPAIKSATMRESGKSTLRRPLRVFAEQKIAETHQLAVIAEAKLDAPTATVAHHRDVGAEVLAQTRFKITLLGGECAK